MTTFPHNFQVFPSINYNNQIPQHAQYMSKSLQKSSQIEPQSHLPSFKDFRDSISGPWNTLIDDGNLKLPPIREPLGKEPSQTSEHTGDNIHPTRVVDKLTTGCWPSELPPQRGPTLVFPDDDDEEGDEREGDAEEKDSGKDDGDDEEPGQCPPSTEQSQSTSQPRLLTVSDSRPILRLSPKSLAEGGPELEAQQHSLLHQYRLPSSSSTDAPTSAPPAYVYQTPTAPQPSSGPVPFSFNVLRAQQGDLVNVRTPSARAQGILRPTAIIEDEDESHKRYRCDWPGCGKKYDRPSSLEVHKYSHTRKQPFPCPEPECRRAFSVKSNMLRHFRSHPRRAGMSAADVSAASARKAASIAAEKDVDDAIPSPKDREKGKDKEMEGGSEMNNKENDQAKSSTATSASSRKPPILTLTPAPSTLTSKTHPGTRSRTTLDTELIVNRSSSVASMSEATASGDPPTVSISIPISPSASPSPSPLLSPHSPQSTYSSAPTSASIMSTGLLSPSFASTSAPASVAFSPPSELLSPPSMYSLNSPYSVQSPHSPPVSTASEKERELETEAEGRASESPLHAMPDCEHERSLSKSPAPITISTATPDQTTSSTVLTRSPSPQQLQLTATRSPSPYSPRFRTNTLYPISDTRSSPGEGFWPSVPLDSGRGRRFVNTLITLGATRLNSPPRSTSPGMSSTPHRTDKRKKPDADNSDDDRGQVPDQGSLSGSGKQTTDSHKRVAEKLQPELSAVQEKVSEQGCWPMPPKPTRNFQRAFVGVMQSESSTSVKEVAEQSLGLLPSASKPAGDVRGVSVEASQVESSVVTKPSSPLRSTTPGPRSASPMETSSVPILETDSSSSHHSNKRRRMESDINDDRTKNSADPAHRSAACQPTSVRHGSATDPDHGFWPSPPKPAGNFQRFLINTLSIDSSTRTTSSPRPRATSQIDRKMSPPTISESHSSHHLSTREMTVNNIDDDETEETEEQIYRPSTSKRIDDRPRDVIEALPRRSASPGSRTLRFAPISSERTLLSSRILESDHHLRSASRLDEEESQQGKGFWPTELPPQTRAFFETPLFDDEADEEDDPGGGGGSENEMDVEEVGGGKKRAPLLFGRTGRSLSLKPGLAEEIEKQKGVKRMET